MEPVPAQVLREVILRSRRKRPLPFPTPLSNLNDALGEALAAQVRPPR
jgi:hypothetical protein